MKAVIPGMVSGLCEYGVLGERQHFFFGIYCIIALWMMWLLSGTGVYGISGVFGV